jgi:hypothetical protein
LVGFWAAGGAGAGVPPVGGPPPPPPSACPTKGGNAVFKDKQVKITIKASASADAVLTALNGLTWPSSNGKLLEIRLGKERIYKPKGGVSSVPAILGVPPLTADKHKRTIRHGKSGTLILIFQNKAGTSAYTGVAQFGTCLVPILP